MTPNDNYSGRTAPLTSKRCILYIYSTNICTKYFKHGIYSPCFSLQSAVCFIILTYLVPVLFTFYIKDVLKLKNNSGAKRLTNDTEDMSAPVTQANAGNNAVVLLSLCQSASLVFIKHFYQRLPHHLSQMLKELPVVDGTDASPLCDFLLKLLKIRQVGQMAGQAIYEIMYPYCRCELLALATNAIAAEESFETFHAPILEQVMPKR